MDKIIIQELEVQIRVGVPETERAQPQRLLVTVEMERDISAAAKEDNLRKTIDYRAVTVRLASIGHGKSWKLIESLAVDMAELVLREFKPKRVTVEIKKFILPLTRYVSVRVVRPQSYSAFEEN